MSIRKGNDIIASTPAVDTVPQQGSANVITSGGVYTALQDYVTLSTPQTITANKAFNGAKISTNSDIEFTSAVAGLVSNRNGTIRNLITRTSFNEVNVGNPYDPTVILGSGVRPRYNTIEYLALYSDIPVDFTGASSVDSGTNGLVPAPAAGDQGKFLQGDGTWATPTAATAWGNITGTLSSQTDLQNALDSKANTDLSNLTSTGANIGNWSHNVTNCITEIPQDIKLELNNGTLTLKAGSKVYNGNGLLSTIASDVSLIWNYTGTHLYAYCLTRNSIVVAAGGTATVSSLPSASTTYKLFYNTSDGKCYYDDNNIAMVECSLPIAICAASSGIKSIDQVFNGFGYIGSTRFVLPNIKWLSPDGRNADGTLKSIQRTNTNVLVETVFSGTVNSIVMVLSIGSVWTSGKYIESETEPSGSYIVWYKPSENILRAKAEGSWSINNNIVVYGYYDTSSDKITGFRTKQQFQALDYNDTDLVVDFQRPTAANNYTWYRKYKSGWVEQGGQISKPDSTAVGVVLPVAMSDSNYSIQITDEFSSNMGTTPSVGNKITTGFNIYQGNGASIVCLWEVKGFAA